MNKDRKVIIITKGMDGSDDISRIKVSVPYGKANTIYILANQRDFVDDMIDLLLQADSVYELKRKLGEIINEE